MTNPDPGPQRIQLTGDYLLEEARANAALSPGHLIEVISTGKVQKHGTEGGIAERFFAVEDALQGRTVLIAYAADELVFGHLQRKGNKVQGILKAGENVVIGTKLISAGDGTLIAEASATSAAIVDDVLAVSQEALDLSATGAADTLHKIRIL